jgi:hypothetical protein
VTAPFRFLTLPLFAGFFMFAGNASAFENQWHFGGGLGVAAPSGAYSLAPAAGVYGAYGISDVFDVKLELTLARATVESRPASLLTGAHAALAYKIDVIQWIPYLGVRAGMIAVSDPVGPFKGLQASAGGIAGVEYAMSRSLGFGLELFLDYSLGDSSAHMLGALATAEYRFGY